MSAPDVVIVGAGIVGASTAWELSARGARVLLVDAGAVSGGTTGLGEGNVLCGDKDAGPELDLARLGLARYAAVEAELGAVARIRRKGALVVHPDAATWAAEPARIVRLRAAGVRAELLGPPAVRALEPALTGDLHGASWFPDDLQCDPRAITTALVDRAVTAGAELRTHIAVDAVAMTRGRVTGVRCGAELVGADAVVLTAGAWGRGLAEAAGLRLPLEPRKGQLVRLRAPARGAHLVAHKVLDGSYLGAVADPDAGLQIASVVETTWEGDVLVGSSRERLGFDTGVDAAVSAALLARAARLFPVLAELRPAAAWAGLRPWLPDGLPAIGPSARVPGLWIGTGHEGAGVALGPITGQVLAQGLCGERPALDLTAFSPDRF